jgi:hypothetical protein
LEGSLTFSIPGIDASRITTQTDLTDTSHRGQAVIVVTFNP